MPDSQLPESSSRLTIDRRTVVKGAVWTVPAIAVVTATPVFAASGDAISITDNGSARTSDVAGATPDTGGTYWNVKLNVALPTETSVTGLTVTLSCLGSSTNGLQHRGSTTTPTNVVGSRGPFQQTGGLYGNETPGVLISSSGADTGGSASEPAYATWIYKFPDALFTAGSARVQPLQLTFKGIGGVDTPIQVAVTHAGVTKGGIAGTSWTCTSATSGALASA